jgi:hypothetical protein
MVRRPLYFPGFRVYHARRKGNLRRREHQVIAGNIFGHCPQHHALRAQQLAYFYGLFLVYGASLREFLLFYQLVK